LQKYFIKKLESEVKGLWINGSLKKRVPSNIHVSIAGIEGESALLLLDRYGIYASTGSACSSESLEVSHVLKAISVNLEYAHGSLRFSLGRDTTKKDLDYVVKKLSEIVDRLRNLSGFYLKNLEFKK
jgi:cysteine desulfurase